MISCLGNGWVSIRIVKNEADILAGRNKQLKYAIEMLKWKINRNFKL